MKQLVNEYQARNLNPYNPLNWEYPALIVIVILSVLLYSTYKQSQNNSEAVLEVSERLRQYETTHIHNWVMDESCSEQLQNSNDGVLRIKTTK